MTCQARGQPFVSHQLAIGLGLLSRVVISKKPHAEGNSLDKGQLGVRSSLCLQQLGDGCTRLGKGILDKEPIHVFPNKILPRSLIDVKETHTHTQLRDGTFTENFLTSYHPQERKFTNLHEKLIEVNKKHCVKKLILKNVIKVTK